MAEHEVIPKHNTMCLSNYRLFIFGLLCLISSCDASNACQNIEASGFKVQKGVEGEYTLDRRCENGPMYTQNQPAVGWGSHFFLYYYHNTEDSDYQGWIFSIYPCSDMAFARSSGQTLVVSPDMVLGPWEEFVKDTMVPNGDINVKCLDGMSMGMIIVLVFITMLSLMALIAAFKIYLEYNRRKHTRRQQPRNTEVLADSQDYTRPDIYSLPSPPPYSEITQQSAPPPYYEQCPDLTTTHSNNSMNYERLEEDYCSREILPRTGESNEPNLETTEEHPGN